MVLILLDYTELSDSKYSNILSILVSKAGKRDDDGSRVGLVHQSELVQI